MIYFITNQTSIGEYKDIERASVDDALSYFRDKEIIEVDTETEGFDPFTDSLLLMQLGDGENQFVIDATTVNVKNNFKDLLENKDKTLIMHNAKFDLKFLFKQGIIPFENIYDTYLAERIISCGIDSHLKSLQACVYRYLKIRMSKEERGLIHKLGHYNSRVIKYAATDVKYLSAIREHQLIKIREQRLYNTLQLENLFVGVLAYVEYCGIKPHIGKWEKKCDQDKEKLLRYEKELNRIVESLENPTYLKQPDLFNDISTCNINWNSSDQIIPLLEGLGLNLDTIDPKTKQPKKSADSKILKSQKNTHFIVPVLLNYKKQKKKVSSYGREWLKHINPVTGRIHPNFRHQILNTGRISAGKEDAKSRRMGEVPLQTIPRTPDADKREEGKIYERECFIPEQGHKFVVKDYTGQETRILAEKSGDVDYLEYSTNPEKDLHCLSARLLNPELANLSVKEIKSKYPHIRQKAKSISFAIPYGGNGATIAQNLSISIQEGERIYNGFMKHFPSLSKYFDRIQRETLDQGYVLINKLTGRKSYFPQRDNYLAVKERIEGIVGHRNSTGETFQGISQEFWRHYTYHKQNNTDQFPELKALISKYFRYRGAMGRSGLNYPKMYGVTKLGELLEG